MEVIRAQAKVYGTDCILELMSFDEQDRLYWKDLYDKWHSLKLGMRDFRSREPNFPEGLSEVAFCLHSGSDRFLKTISGNINASFDTFNTTTQRAEQIKATSIKEDLTSFGPRSKWDDLYFMDFYNEGSFDGSFDLYLIPSELIYNHQINRDQTFMDQQLEGRRPRLSIKRDIIKPNNITPISQSVKIWMPLDRDQS